MLSKEEFIDIIKEHQNLIYKVSVSYCRDEDERKDLQQEILMQLWRSMNKYDGRVKMTTWIYRIALNTSISFWRKQSGRRKRNVTPDMPLWTFAAQDDGEGEKEDNLHRLYELIGELGELDRAMILLWLDNSMYSEIAEIMGISETNVATRLGRIKTKLKNRFDNE